MSGIKQLNTLSESALQEALFRVCASQTWVRSMVKGRPYKNEIGFADTAVKIWQSLSESDRLEAFSGHPRIGAKTHSVVEAVEQKGMDRSTPELKVQMQKLNDRYFEKFGFIFLIHAKGKTAEEMLSAISQRVKNGRKKEIQNASMEQEGIILSRLGKLLENS